EGRKRNEDGQDAVFRRRPARRRATGRTERAGYGAGHAGLPQGAGQWLRHADPGGELPAAAGDPGAELAADGRGSIRDLRADARPRLVPDAPCTATGDHGVPATVCADADAAAVRPAKGRPMRSDGLFVMRRSVTVAGQQGLLEVVQALGEV